MDTEQLWSRYENASRKVKQGLITTKGGTVSEDEYAIAYQNLVKEGQVMQIKKKYR